MFADCHVHLDGYESPQLAQTLEQGQRRGLEMVVAAGMNLESSAATLGLAALHPTIRPAVGLHPWEAATVTDDLYGKLRSLAATPGVVALSEIGLDYGRSTVARDIQRQCFVAQLRLAQELRLPVIVHCREAHDEMIALLHQAALPRGGAIHNFAGFGSPANALADWLDLGFYVSLGYRGLKGPERERLASLAKTVPEDRLLLETDATPREEAPHLLDIFWVAQEVARLRGSPAESVAATATANLKRLLKLPS